VCECSKPTAISIYHTMHFYFWFQLFPEVETWKNAQLQLVYVIQRRFSVLYHTFDVYQCNAITVIPYLAFLFSTSGSHCFQGWKTWKSALFHLVNVIQQQFSVLSHTLEVCLCSSLSAISIWGTIPCISASGFHCFHRVEK
jgi:hypothetical protein